MLGGESLVSREERTDKRKEVFNQSARYLGCGCLSYEFVAVIARKKRTNEDKECLFAGLQCEANPAFSWVAFFQVAALSKRESVRLGELSAAHVTWLPPAYGRLVYGAVGGRLSDAAIGSHGSANLWMQQYMALYKLYGHGPEHQISSKSHTQPLTGIGGIKDHPRCSPLE